MGMKPSSNYQSDRPESGGADKDGIRENNGLLEREKEKFASEEAKKRAERLDQPNRDDDLIPD